MERQAASARQKDEYQIPKLQASGQFRRARLEGNVHLKHLGRFCPRRPGAGR